MSICTFGKALAIEQSAITASILETIVERQRLAMEQSAITANILETIVERQQLIEDGLYWSWN